MFVIILYRIFCLPVDIKEKRLICTDLQFFPLFLAGVKVGLSDCWTNMGWGCSRI